MNPIESNIPGMSLMSEDELINAEGGHPIVAAVAVAAGVGVGVVGLLVVGAAVGYGVYRLVDWATD